MRGDKLGLLAHLASFGTPDAGLYERRNVLAVQQVVKTKSLGKLLDDEGVGGGKRMEEEEG